MIEGDAEVTSWIVLSSNSRHQVQAFGTKTGQTFKSEQSADHWAKVLSKNYPHLDFLVLPVTPMPQEEDKVRSTSDTTKEGWQTR